MLSILDRYFLRELAQTVAATVVVLMVIVAGTAFAAVLQQVAKGSFPASVMFQVLSLRTLGGLTNMLPTKNRDTNGRNYSDKQSKKIA